MIGHAGRVYQELSEDEVAARAAEASMQGRTHNLLNQSVAAGYRNGAKPPAGSRDQSDGDKVSRDRRCWCTLQCAVTNV